MKNQINQINPVVTTGWLLANNGQPDLVIIDIRSPEYFGSGHIPGAINLPFPQWVTNRAGLELEVPDQAVLFETLGRAGITPDKRIVVVNNADQPYPLADSARVADTLIYAGCPHVAILDGGFTLWCDEQKPFSKENRKIAAVKFNGVIDSAMFVSKEQVQQAMGRAVILDTRTPDVYFGVTQESGTARPGHIPGAKNLPAPWIWQNRGTFRDAAELARMAEKVVGTDLEREIITYCGAGGYASGWWFVLARILGYTKVRFYDGSAQEWAADLRLPLSLYCWE